MIRDPKEKYVNDCLNSISIHKFFPILFYYRCDKCGMEYKRELMYECESRDCMTSFVLRNMGCSHCFSSKNDFRKWLEKTGKLYTKEFLEDYYDHPLKFFSVNGDRSVIFDEDIKENFESR